MADGLLALVFVAGALVSLSSSWLLVTRLERLGTRLGLSESLLGVVAALGANAPEITAAVTAVATHQATIGAGVALGSNVFNLAALLGFAAVVAGRIALHRRVIVLQGLVAVWVAAVVVAVAVRGLSPGAGLGIALCAFVPYLVVLGMRQEWLSRSELFARTRVARGLSAWLISALADEELELAGTIELRPGRRADAVVAGGAVIVVIAASIAMEKAAARLGGHLGLSQIVLGGLILAGVTSLPNVVAAVYLALRGRGAATLSTAMNSNALNATAGLLLPATIVGLSAGSGKTTLVAAWYLGLTVLALAIAYVEKGLRRAEGAFVIAAYVLFVVLLASGAV